MSALSVGYLLAFLTAACWAVLAIILKKSLEFADVGVIASLRLLLAAAGLGFYLALQKPAKLKVLLNLPWLGCVAGVLLACNYYGFTKGVELISASHAQVMIQLGPLFLMLSGVIFFSERLGAREILGIATAMVGYLLFYNQQLIGIVGSDSGLFNSGNLWLLMAAVTWAAFASFQKVLFKRYTPAQLNLLIYTIAGICLLPLGDFSVLKTFGTYEWMLIAALAINTIIAYGAFAEALSRIPAGHLSLIITLNPMLTLFLIWLAAEFNVVWVPREPISMFAFVGALLVVTGVAVTVTRKRSKT